MDLKGLAAIVTGGASGLGAATAEMLVGEGAAVTIFDIAADKGRAVAGRIGATFIACDVRDESRVIDSIAAAERTHGTARVLVNCAGISYSARTVGDGDFAPHSLDRFREVIDVNLTGTFNMIAHFAARAAKAAPLGEERGVIVNTSSAAAFDAGGGAVAYAASKAAVAGMTRPIACDLAGFGIRVVAIAPGAFATPMVLTLPKASQDGLASLTQFPHRMGTPAEYAQMVKSIIANPMLNGGTIRLDGALRL